MGQQRLQAVHMQVFSQPGASGGNLALRNTHTHTHYMHYMTSEDIALIYICFLVTYCQLNQYLSKYNPNFSSHLQLDDSP